VYGVYLRIPPNTPLVITHKITDITIGLHIASFAYIGGRNGGVKMWGLMLHGCSVSGWRVNIYCLRRPHNAGAKGSRGSSLL